MESKREEGRPRTEVADRRCTPPFSVNAMACRPNRGFPWSKAETPRAAKPQTPGLVTLRSGGFQVATLEGTEPQLLPREGSDWSAPGELRPWAPGSYLRGPLDAALSGPACIDSTEGTNPRESDRARNNAAPSTPLPRSLAQPVPALCGVRVRSPNPAAFFRPCKLLGDTSCPGGVAFLTRRDQCRGLEDQQWRPGGSGMAGNCSAERARAVLRLLRKCIGHASATRRNTVPRFSGCHSVAPDRLGLQESLQ